MGTERSAVVRSAGTLVNLLPAAFPVSARVFKNMNALIPVYQADGSLYACVPEQRLARLQSAAVPPLLRRNGLL